MMFATLLLVHEPVGLRVPVCEEREREEEGDEEGGGCLVPQDVGGVHAERSHLQLDPLAHHRLQQKKTNM